MFSLVRFSRPAAALAAALLVVGIAPGAPAAAETLHAAVSLSAKVVYLPSNAELGPPGTSKDAPADAGAAPGSISVHLVVTSTGTDPLDQAEVVPLHVANGHLDSLKCLRSPVLLHIGWSFECTATISGIAHGTVNEDAFGVSAVGSETGAHVSASGTVWAEASPAGTPRPTISVGGVVWRDADRNQLPYAGQPGIPGVRVLLQLECCQPTPDSGYVFLDTTTDAQGVYRFTGLERGYRYRVTIDRLQNPGLANLAMWSARLGSGDGSTREITFMTDQLLESDEAVDFGFGPKWPMVIDIDAPTRALAGRTIDVAGRPYRPDMPEVGGFDAVLEFRAGGTTTWTKVADANDERGDGKRHVQVKVSRSGFFRYRSTGQVYVSPAVSREAHVLVSLAPVTITNAVPATVRAGTPLTVSGTITRSGTPFTTGRIVLERSTDATTWATVADLRSSTGSLKAVVDPARTGSYRFRYLGDSTTAAATSPAVQVVVTSVNARRPSGR
jgi:hypothetical protein